MIDPQKLVFSLAALVVGLCICRALVKRDKDVRSKISLEDLLLDEEGKLSRAACVLLGSFILSAWVIGYLTFTGKLTEAYFGAFLLAWVTPTVTKLIVNRNDPVQLVQKANESEQIKADIEIAKVQQ